MQTFDLTEETMLDRIEKLEHDVAELEERLTELMIYGARSETRR